MTEGFSGRKTPAHFNHKKFLDQVLGFLSDFQPAGVLEVVFTSTYGLLKSFQGLCPEWRVSTHNDVEDYSTGPKVAFFGIITLDDFRSHVVRSSEKLGQPLVWAYSTRDAEVD